jgi:hypothetical protein
MPCVVICCFDDDGESMIAVLIPWVFHIGHGRYGRLLLTVISLLVSTAHDDGDSISCVVLSNKHSLSTATSLLIEYHETLERQRGASSSSQPTDDIATGVRVATGN